MIVRTLVCDGCGMTIATFGKGQPLPHTQLQTIWISFEQNRSVDVCGGCARVMLNQLSAQCGGEAILAAFAHAQLVKEKKESPL